MLIDRAGKALGEATAKAVEPVRPHPGWSEQNPADWWSATLAAVDKLSKSHPAEMAAVRGIGLSGHMHGATLLGKNDEVLRPCILWNDGRSAAECARDGSGAAARCASIAGNIAMPGFTAPKIAWVRKHEPADLRQDRQGPAAQGLCPPAADRRACRGHVRRRRHALARRRQARLVRRAARRHRPQPLAHAAPGRRLRALRRRSRPSSSARWGMTGNVVVAGGAGDNAAAACGIGAIRPGEGFVSLGTSGVLFVSNDRFRPNTEGAVHAFCHAIPNTWHQMGVILSRHRQPQLAVATSPARSRPSSRGAAEAQFKGPGEEIFLPYLSGERTPHNNADARGSLRRPLASQRSGAARAGGDGGRHLRLPRLPARAQRRRHQDRPAARGRRRQQIGSSGSR